MIKIFNKDTNELLGRISQEEFDFLKSNLELESLEDTDFYITKETIDAFSEDGAPTRVVEMLRNGMRADAAIEIRWDQDLATPSASG